MNEKQKLQLAALYGLPPEALDNPEIAKLALGFAQDFLRLSAGWGKPAVTNPVDLSGWILPEPMRYWHHDEDFAVFMDAALTPVDLGDG